MTLPTAVGLGGTEAVGVDGGIVFLRTSGQDFCSPFRENRRTLRRLGKRAYKRFIEVAQLIPCLYGAILVESSLEEPGELQRDSNTASFCDCFISRDLVENSVADRARSIAGDTAYREELSTGVYISFTEEFNPRGMGLRRADADERSRQIARLIAAAVETA
jgi:hypothetical protein